MTYLEYMKTITKTEHCKELGISVENYDLLKKEQHDALQKAFSAVDAFGRSVNDNEIGSKIKSELLTFTMKECPGILIDIFKKQ